MIIRGAPSPIEHCDRQNSVPKKGALPPPKVQLTLLPKSMELVPASMRLPGLALLSCAATQLTLPVPLTFRKLCTPGVLVRQKMRFPEPPLTLRRPLTVSVEPDGNCMLNPGWAMIRL